MAKSKDNNNNEQLSLNLDLLEQQVLATQDLVEEIKDLKKQTSKNTKAMSDASKKSSPKKDSGVIETLTQHLKSNKVLSDDIKKLVIAVSKSGLTKAELQKIIPLGQGIKKGSTSGKDIAWDMVSKFSNTVSQRTQTNYLQNTAVQSFYKTMTGKKFNVILEAERKQYQKQTAENKKTAILAEKLFYGLMSQEIAFQKKTANLETEFEENKTKARQEAFKKAQQLEEILESRKSKEIKDRYNAEQVLNKKLKRPGTSLVTLGVASQWRAERETEEREKITKIMLNQLKQSEKLYEQEFNQKIQSQKQIHTAFLEQRKAEVKYILEAKKLEEDLEKQKSKDIRDRYNAEQVLNKKLKRPGTGLVTMDVANQWRAEREDKERKAQQEKLDQTGNDLATSMISKSMPLIKDTASIMSMQFLIGLNKMSGNNPFTKPLLESLIAVSPAFEGLFGALGDILTTAVGTAVGGAVVGAAGRGLGGSVFSGLSGAMGGAATASVATGAGGASLAGMFMRVMGAIGGLVTKILPLTLAIGAIVAAIGLVYKVNTQGRKDRESGKDSIWSRINKFFDPSKPTTPTTENITVQKGSVVTNSGYYKGPLTYNKNLLMSPDAAVQSNNVQGGNTYDVFNNLLTQAGNPFIKSWGDQTISTKTTASMGKTLESLGARFNEYNKYAPKEEKINLLIPISSVTRNEKKGSSSYHDVSKANAVDLDLSSWSPTQRKQFYENVVLPALSVGEVQAIVQETVNSKNGWNVAHIQAPLKDTSGQTLLNQTIANKSK